MSALEDPLCLSSIPQPKPSQNCTLNSPSFLQIEPWKTHIWQDEKLRPRRREIGFRVLVKYVEVGVSLCLCCVPFTEAASLTPLRRAGHIEDVLYGVGSQNSSHQF